MVLFSECIIAKTGERCEGEGEFFVNTETKLFSGAEEAVIMQASIP